MKKWLDAMLVNFLIAVLKISQQKQLRKEGFIEVVVHPCGRSLSQLVTFHLQLMNRTMFASELRSLFPLFPIQNPAHETAHISNILSPQ